MSYGLYIHIPFCIKKCNYCDFVSVPYDSEFVDLYLKALDKEMALYAESGSHPRTVYIGGGTPTCLEVGQIDRLMNMLQRHFSLERGIEFTVEANPGTLTADKLSLLREGGANRLSIGAQSFYEKHLRKMGRVHNALDIAVAMDLARKAGFTNINLDLIFGLPRQTIKDWQNTLQQALLLNPDHISAYGLKVEEGTPFALERDLGFLPLCEEEEELAMYLWAVDFLTERGIAQYEISNFARPGMESRHNLIYWRSEDYLGLGVAAHSFMGGTRWNNLKVLPKYIKSLNDVHAPVEAKEVIPPAQQLEDAIFLALRTINGIDLNDFANRFGVKLSEKYGYVIEKHVKNGLLLLEDGKLRLTREGLYLSNEVMVDFI